MSTRLLISCDPGLDGSTSGFAWPNAVAVSRSLGSCHARVQERSTVTARAAESSQSVG